jgi:hypothetical protein
MNKKNRFTKLAFSINGLLFLMGGISLINDGKSILGVIQLLASIFNITMILKIRNKSSIEKLNYIILAMNIVVCLSIAIDNILAGKLYIQFVWIIAAIVSLVALILQIKRKKTLPIE